MSRSRKKKLSEAEAFEVSSAKEAADEAVSLAEAAVRRWNALPASTEEAQKHQASHNMQEIERTLIAFRCF